MARTSSAKTMADLLVCTRCYRQYPMVRIVWCRQTTIIGGLYLCTTCHRILHGSGCRFHRYPGYHKQALICSLCYTNPAELACPLCATKSEDSAVTATFCGECNMAHHVDHKEIHLDHVFPLPLN